MKNEAYGPKSGRVVVRRILRPVKDKSTGRNVGSTGVVNERMLIMNEGLMLGKKLSEAAQEAGYSDAYGAKKRLENHPGVILLNQAALARAGVTLDVIAQKVKEGMSAQRTVAVSVIQEDGQIIGKELIKENDYMAQHKFLTTAITMSGHDLRQEKLQVDLNQRIVTTTVNINVSTGLEGLKGAALMDAYKERMRALANGEEPNIILPPPAETGDRTPLQSALDDSRRYATLEAPTVRGAQIAMNEVNGEVIETIDIRSLSDVARHRNANRVRVRIKRPVPKAVMRARLDPALYPNSDLVEILNEL